jgi:hypothetical protein
MTASAYGLGLILCGWCAYLFALASPAIEIGELVIADGYWGETMSGYRCFTFTLDPANWLFAPLLLLYLCANVLMLMSPLMLWARVGIQKLFGVCLLISFFVALTAPYCYAGIRSSLVGCFAWMASFAATGLGFVLCNRSPELWKNWRS